MSRNGNLGCHLNPVRAGLVSADAWLSAYPWSSLVWYVAAAEHRPEWIRVDRLLGEHGIGADTPSGRQEFERRMEARRAQETDGQEWAPVRRGWCLGSEGFKKELLEQMEGRLGEHHAGQLRRESAEAKAEQIIGEELACLGWTAADLGQRHKSDPGKLVIAARLRRETTLPVGWIATRLNMGTRKSASTRLQEWKRSDQT